MKDSFSNTVTAKHPWLPCLISKQPHLATDKSILHAPQHCLVVFELTVSLCFPKRSSAYLEGVVMRTMQMSQEYSSAQLTKVHTPSSTSHSGPLFQSSSWPIWACTLTQAGAVDNLCFPFIFPQLHTSQTPQSDWCPSPSSGILFSCCWVRLSADCPRSQSQHTDVLLCSGWAEQTLRQCRPSRSSYYPPSPPILPFRFSSKSQWQSQPLHFSWPLKTKRIFL